MTAPIVHCKQNRLQQLRGFCHVAAAGSFSKAANQMLLTQPAVSQQVKSLETELRIPLFFRRSGKIHLTSDGELLFQMAHPLIEELESLEMRFRQQRLDVEKGQIQIAAGLSTIQYFLPRFVESFRRAYPDIELAVQEVTCAEGLQRLRSGLVDLTIGPFAQVPEDVEFHGVASYEMVVITSRGHPLGREKALSLAQVSTYPLVLPPRNDSLWQLADSTFKQHGFSYKVSMEVGGWETIKTYVELGLGISIISKIGIAGDENLEVLPAGALFPGRTYGVVLLKRKILTPQARRFANLVISSSSLSTPIPSTDLSDPVAASFADDSVAS